MYIEVHYHFVRERILSGEVKLVYVPTDRQVVDIFTKPLGLDKLQHFSSKAWLAASRHAELQGEKREREGER